MANRALLNDPKNLRCFTGSRAGWNLNGKPVQARSVKAHFSAKTPPAPKIPDLDAFLAMKNKAIRGLKEEVLIHAFSPIPAELNLGESKEHNGLSERDGTLLIDGLLRHSCRTIAAPEKSGKTIVLLAAGEVEKSLPRARSLAKGGANVLVVETTRLKDKHLRRYAALVGHTTTSLAINDALAAVRALRKTSPLPSDTITIRGKGDAAAAALYAAVVDSGIAGVMLEDCPDRFHADTALLGILRHTDLPRSAALLFPRPLVLLGQAAPGFDWTAKLYEQLGRKEAFKRKRSRL